MVFPLPTVPTLKQAVARRLASGSVSKAPPPRYPVAMNETATPTENPPLWVRFKRYLRQLAFRILVYLVAYLVISVVTIGPCFWYWHEATFVNGPTWIAKFYAPLVWLCDHFWPLGWLVNKYVNWWIL